MNENSDSPSGLALRCKHAELVVADVRVLRRVDDVAPVGELGAEGMVVFGVFLGVDHVGRPAFQAVLADDHRPLLAGLQVLRQQQDAVGEHVGVEVERHFVARYFGSS